MSNNKMNDQFAGDIHSYILIKYNSIKNHHINTYYFPNINDAYKYVVDNYKVTSSDFLESYKQYLNGSHFKNGHGMYIPHNYVFEFEYEGVLYELYGITQGSKYILATFNTESNLIGCIKGFDCYEDAKYEKDVEQETYAIIISLDI